jgi:hypothetical protein
MCGPRCQRQAAVKSKKRSTRPTEWVASTTMWRVGMPPAWAAQDRLALADRKPKDTTATRS